MTDALFKPDTINFSFSGQVKSLTYDVITKSPQDHKMPQLYNVANCRHFFRKMKLQKLTSPEYTHLVYLGLFMQVI